MKHVHWWAVVTAFSLVLTACASSSQPASQVRTPAEGRSATVKRIVAGIRGTTPVLYRKLQVGASYSGLTYLEPMVNAGMVTIDTQGALHPQLSEAVPTVENGQWKLLPDGR